MNLTTFIAHPFCGALDITLVSPVGHRVTMSKNIGFDGVNLFDGTIWSDQAGVALEAGVFLGEGSTGPGYSRLIPEEAMGAFIGENPNGVWTLWITSECGTNTVTNAARIYRLRKP